MTTSNSSSSPPNAAVHEALFEDVWKQWSREAGAKAPPTLHHYTGAEGLVGVLQSKQIWASHVHCLNDASEGAYAHRLLMSEVRGRLSDAARAQGSADRDQRAAAFWQFYDLAARMLDETLTDHAGFVACFCERPNLLSQWRAYGSQGGGYSVEIPFPALGAIRAIKRHAIEKVVYDPDQQVRLLSIVFDRLETQLSNLVETESGSALTGDIRDLVGRLWAFSFRAFVSFKHPSFSEEQEWRLTIHSRDLEIDETLGGLRFRAAHGRVIPYAAINLAASDGRLPIASVMIGPGQREGAARPIRLVLEACDLGDIRVFQSDIPLR
jgi:hypothetical protein